MNRKDLQTLANTRIKEAKALLDQGMYDGAYYLCGYGVECALKACIAKSTKKYDFPDKRIVIDSYTHDLLKLAKTAHLYVDLEAEKKKNPAFELNWIIVQNWSEESRYKNYTKADATDLYKAVKTHKNSILSWIKQRW